MKTLPRAVVRLGLLLGLLQLGTAMEVHACVEVYIGEGYTEPYSPAGKCPPCQKWVNNQCSPDSAQNNYLCHQLLEDQIVRLQVSATGWRPIDITIDQSCNSGTCQNGKCNLISDRWGITAIVRAVEGAVHTIVHPPIVVKELPPGPITVKKLGERQVFSCLEDPLRKQVLQTLAKGLKIKCVNSTECSEGYPEHDGSVLACVDPDIPDIIWVTNYNLEYKAAKIAENKTFMGQTPPSGEKAFEATLFHEILHASGVRSHVIVTACEKGCYGFAANEKDFTATGPTRTDPQYCIWPEGDESATRGNRPR